MKLHLSKCTNSDLDRLISITRKTFIDAFAEDNNPDDFKAYMKRAFSKEQLLLEMADPQTSFYLVLCENEVLGYFKLNENEAQSDIKDENAIELERIYVKSTFQGNQVGHWMLNRIKYIATKKKEELLMAGGLGEKRQCH